MFAEVVGVQLFSDEEALIKRRVLSEVFSSLVQLRLIRNESVLRVEYNLHTTAPQTLENPERKRALNGI